MKLHKRYGTKQTQQRSVLGQCRPLFAPSVDGRLLAKLQQKRARIEKQQPHQIRGHNIFIKDLVGLAKGKQARGSSLEFAK
jgi:hypothetical protein